MDIVIDRIHWTHDGGTVCIHCKHWNLRERTTCSAFPNGIPEPILKGEIDHTSPYPGDNGIRFEAVEEAEIPSAQREPQTTPG